MRSILTAVVVLLAGCGHGDTVRDWARRSPLRESMRAMALDCAVIADAGRRPHPDGWEEMSCAADDVARRTELVRSLWRPVESAAAALAAAASDPSRAVAAYGALRKACCDCHVATQSPSQRGFDLDTIEAWMDGRLVVHPDAAPTGPVPEVPASNPNQASMREMLHAMSAVAADLQAGRAFDAGRAETIRDEARVRIDRWQAALDAARETSAAAAEWDLDAARAAYRRLAGACAVCHAAETSGERTPAAPPDW